MIELQINKQHKYKLLIYNCPVIANQQLGDLIDIIITIELLKHTDQHKD